MKVICCAMACLLVTTMVVATGVQTTTVGEDMKITAKQICKHDIEAKGEYIVLVDARVPIRQMTQSECESLVTARVEVADGESIREDAYHVAFYSAILDGKNSDDQLQRIVKLWEGEVLFSNEILSSALLTSQQDKKMSRSKNSLQSWVLYSTWHTPMAQALLSEESGPYHQAPISMEAIIRSNGKLSIEDVYHPPVTQGDVLGAYYQTIPAVLGPYCIYRERPGQSSSWRPSCVNITKTLTRHARLLTAAGIDNIMTDATNQANLSSVSDVLDLRPMEVLAEEWLQLRRMGIPTPRISAWSLLTNGNIYKDFLANVYNNESYSDLISRDPATGKKVFFAVDNKQNPLSKDTVAEIESNGGRNDVVVVSMWVPGDVVNDESWFFFSGCIDEKANNQTTTTIANMEKCSQKYTPSSPIGPAVTVSPSYQTGYASFPFMAPGKHYDYLLHLQFDSNFDVMDRLGNGYIRNLMSSSFNELLAGHFTNYGYNKKYIRSMGLEWDPDNDFAFVDTYGCDLARDIEPSVECGDAVWKMYQSCRNVMTLKTIFGSSLRHGQTTDGNIAGEPCGQKPQSPTQNVWSMAKQKGNSPVQFLDSLLSTSEGEVNFLIQQAPSADGAVWKEVCNPIGNPTAFCWSLEFMKNQLAVTGPFEIFRSGTPRSVGYQGGRVPLHCCRSNVTGQHFFSSDPTCEGQVVEGLLGYLSTARTSESPRSFRRCRDAHSGLEFHSLDYPCQGVSVVQVGDVMGYVH